MRTTLFVLAILFFFLAGCSDLIEYSPYDTNVSSRDINGDHIERISGNPFSETDTLRFAVFSDVHDSYDDMIDAIRDINRRGNIEFIVVNGDITVAGLAKEFEWYADLIPESDIPLVTTIGNHDCLANGLVIYRRLFGPDNRSFIKGNYKFILFNNVIWENHNTSPDYEWLRDQLQHDYHNVILSHIPPISSDIGPLHRILYNSIVDTTNTRIAIHSSAHDYYQYYYNGVHSLITTTIKEREYYIITTIGGQFKIKRINF